MIVYISQKQMKPTSLFLATFIATIGLGANADNNVKDGRPCLSGICVGDEISQLAGVKWDTAVTAFGSKPLTAVKYDGKALDETMKIMAPQPRDLVIRALPYLRNGEFDSDGVTKLSALKGFCEPIPLGLTGKFKSESGHATRVILNAIPSSDGKSQALRVQFIYRTLPASLTSEQLKDVHEQLKQRYAGVKEAYMGDPKTPAWKFSTAEREIVLFAPIVGRRDQHDLLRSYPGCTQAARID